MRFIHAYVLCQMDYSSPVFPEMDKPPKCSGGSPGGGGGSGGGGGGARPPSKKIIKNEDLFFTML